MKDAFPRILPLLAVLMGLCSCQSTAPTAGDMDRYYKEAQARSERQIARLTEMRDAGKLTADEYTEKVRVAQASVGKNAMEIAWTRHDMQEAIKRSLSIPTGDHPVNVDPPGLGGSSDSFYHAAGSEGQGYQGQGSGMWHGYQAGSSIDALGGMFNRTN